MLSESKRNSNAEVGWLCALLIGSRGTQREDERKEEGEVWEEHRGKVSNKVYTCKYFTRSHALRSMLLFFRICQWKSFSSGRLLISMYSLTSSQINCILPLYFWNCAKWWNPVISEVSAPLPPSQKMSGFLIQLFFKLWKDALESV